MKKKKTLRLKIDIFIIEILKKYLKKKKKKITDGR